jgi:hypothetical protein
MLPEEIQRTIQLLRENQATDDARLAEIEIKLDRLTLETSNLAGTQREMQGEFREGLQRILTVSEQTMKAVRQVAEAEARTIRRVNVLEDRVDALENSGE